MLAQWFVTACTGPVIAAAMVTGFNNSLNTVNKKESLPQALFSLLIFGQQLWLVQNTAH